MIEIEKVVLGGSPSPPLGKILPSTLFIMLKVLQNVQISSGNIMIGRHRDVIPKYSETTWTTVKPGKVCINRKCLTNAVLERM